MPTATDSAAQDDETGFSIPGQDDDSAQGGPPAPPPAPAPVQQAQNAPAAPSSAGANDDQEAPKASGRAMFLGNLLKTILSGVQNAPGNPNNAFDRGFQSASPQAQQQRQNQQQMAQAQISKAQSDADIEKMNVSLTGMKALQYEYMLKRLPQQQQQEHLDAISKFKDGLIKSGASVEAEGDDEKAADAQAIQLNGNDPRATNHAGRFYSLPTMDSEGKAKFDTVYVPNKDTLQQDFKYKDANGDEQTIAAGTPMSAALGRFVDNQNNKAKDQTKDQHKMMADALKPNVSDATANQTIGWLQEQQKQNTPLYQQNKNAVDAQINTLKAAHSQNFAEKLAQAKAKADQKPGDMTIGTLNGKQVAGTVDELKSAGAAGITKAGAAEAEKIQNARSLINVFDSKDPGDPGLTQLAAKLDSEGKLGPAAIRFQQWLNQGNTAANFNAGDPDVQRLFTKMGLATTGLMQVHVGARGSAQMLEHFEDLAKAKEMSPKAFRTALDTEERYVRMKAMRPGEATASSDKKSAASDAFAQFGGKQRTQ